MDFPKLQKLVTRMGASSSSWRLRPYKTKEQQIREEELRKELQQGKDISSLAVNKIDGSSGVLILEGEQIVIYIKDTRQDKDTLLRSPEEAKKFHIAECSTIGQMRRKGRFDRYVATNRQDGKFLVEATEPDGEFEAQLLVCMNCLKELDWKGCGNSDWDTIRVLRKKFSLQDFLAEYTTFFSQRPRYTDLTAPQGGYAKDWHRLATRIKRARGWRCEECGVNLSRHQELLHGHHKNGVTSDNSRENIAVLCLLCHSEQPYHGRVQPSDAQRELLESLRE